MEQTKVSIFFFNSVYCSKGIVKFENLQYTGKRERSPVVHAEIRSQDSTAASIRQRTKEGNRNTKKRGT